MMMDKILKLAERPEFLFLLAATVLIVIIGYVIVLKADKIFNSRLRVHKRIVPMDKLSKLDRETRERNVNSVATLLAEKTNNLYAASDPNSTKKIKLLMIRAGFFQPNAAGVYLLLRPIMAAVSGIAAFIYVEFFTIEWTTTDLMMAIGFGVAAGYYLPQFYIGRRIKKLTLKNRQGFPDFMDLMIVCVEAGLSMEAAISRIAEEIEKSYPNLSIHLNIAALEVRSGRTLEDALQSMAVRIDLDEVKSFATLLKQSKELGTSLSGALKVYSDDMRDKRMAKAEEKAHALPAKMSVPVTLCILPVILIIAALPVAFKFSSGG